MSMKMLYPVVIHLMQLLPSFFSNNFFYILFVFLVAPHSLLNLIYLFLRVSSLQIRFLFLEA